MATESIKYLSPDTDNKTETKVFHDQISMLRELSIG